jgi:hypothetical protein
VTIFLILGVAIWIGASYTLIELAYLYWNTNGYDQDLPILIGSIAGLVGMTVFGFLAPPNDVPPEQPE